MTMCSFIRGRRMDVDRVFSQGYPLRPFLCHHHPTVRAPFLSSFPGFLSSSALSLIRDFCYPETGTARIATFTLQSEEDDIVVDDVVDDAVVAAVVADSEIEPAEPYCYYSSRSPAPGAPETALSKAASEEEAGVAAAGVDMETGIEDVERNEYQAGHY